MILKKIVKFFLAGLLSIVVLCIIFTFYSLLPIHQASNLGNTDYVWPANSCWIKMSEGISWGKFDEFGFNNLPNKIMGSGYKNTDILILGSSHMEATNVMQNKNLASLLQKKIPNKKVYNMGISGHAFTNVSSYLTNTLTLPNLSPKLVIIETNTVNFSNDEIIETINHTVPIQISKDKGVIAKLQRLPFLRNMYHQFKNGLGNLLFPHFKKETSTSYTTDTFLSTNTEYYHFLFEYLSNILKEYNTDLIIFYHPTEMLNIDGSVTFNIDDNLKLFSRLCEENDIIFVNMENAFYEMYEKEHKLPHGFSTGEIGTGHLNSFGHECIANELYKVITEEL